MFQKKMIKMVIKKEKKDISAIRYPLFNNRILLLLHHHQLERRSE